MAATFVRTANRSGFLAAALALCALSALPAAAQTVDTFETGQAALNDPPGGASSVVTAGADILGLNRGLAVRRWSGAGPVTAQVASGALTVSIAPTTPDSRGEAVVTWDGDSNPLVLSHTGLGGVNLTGGDAFRLTVAAAAAGVELTFTVYTDAGNASVAGLVLPAIASPSEIDVPFASFLAASGTGADFANVGAIVLAVRGTEKTLTLDGVGVVASLPTVTASLTDNATSAQPGDTLSYRATLGNAGPGTASTLTLSTLLDDDSTLSGSVEVSPLAFDDQYVGAVVGTDFSVSTPGVLVNDVDGDGDALTVAAPGLRPTAQGGNATVNEDGSFVYSPPALFQGLDTFTYDANDGNGILGPGVATIHVGCAAITVSRTTLPPGVVGTSYGPETFTATGANGAVTWSVVGTLPAGMNFSAAGVLNGTPTEDGSFPLTFVAMDPAGCTGSQAITLVVNSAPTISSANATTFTVGQAGTFTVTTTGLPAPAIAIGGVPLPGTLTFVDNGDGTGTLSGTPDAGTGGTYALTFTATNVVGSSPPQSFTLTVNQAPAITSANAATFTVGQAGSFTVTTSGFPAPSIARGGVPLPGTLTFVDNGDGTGTLSGTPNAGTGGTYAITFTATNVVTSSPQQSFTLTVNQAPAITSANSATFAPALAGQTFTVTTTGFPRNPGMAITRTGTLPAGVTFTDNNDGTATIAGTPDAGTQSGSPYLWTVTASNGVPPDAVQNPFTFNVTCPTITVSGTIPALTFNVAMSTATFTRTGGNGTITWSATALPAGLVIGAANGQVTGTPSQTGTFDVVVTATDAGLCTGSLNVTVTVAPVATNDSYDGGVDNTQYVITGGSTATPATPSVQRTTRLVANDLPAGNVTATPATVTTTQNGSVTIVADGTFLYTPPVRPSPLAAITADTFAYTVQSNTGGGAAVTSAPATVTIGLVGRVWYVLNNGAAGNGQSQSPLQTLAAAQTASTANDHIFVYRGDGTTSNLSNGIVLKAGQTLVGQGVTLVVNGNTLVNATSNPLIRNTAGHAVTLANGVTVTGLSIDSASGNGISGTSVTTATVTSTVSVANATGAGFLLSGNASGDVSFAAPISAVTGRHVDIRNRTGGTVTISGAISGSGTGVFLDTNTGATINVSGGLAVSSGAAAAFTATGGGTVTVTGSANTLATTTGTALNVQNTTIGAAGLTFRTVSTGTAVTGPANGIVLNTTGSSGGLTVTGNSSGSCGGSVTNTSTPGTLATVGAPATADCTGGLIQNSTGVGVVLNSTKNVSLTRVRILNSGTDGITVNAIDGFTLDHSLVIDNSPAPGAARGIVFGNFISGTSVNGAIAIKDSTITMSQHDNLAVGIASGSSSWTVTNNVFSFSGGSGGGGGTYAIATGNNGINFEIRNAATVTGFTMTDNALFGNFADGIQIAAASGATGSLVATLQRNSFSNNNIAMDLNALSAANMTYTVQNNTIENTTRRAVAGVDGTSQGVNVFQGTPSSGVLNLRFTGNSIGDSALAGSGSAFGNCLRVNFNAGSASTVNGVVLIDANTMRECPVGRGIEIIGRNGNGQLDVTVTNNNVNHVNTLFNPGTSDFPLAAIFVQSHETVAGSSTHYRVRSDIRGNTVPAGSNFDLCLGYLLVAESQVAPASSISEVVDNSPPSANVAAELSSQNTGSTCVVGAPALIPGPITTPP